MKVSCLYCKCFRSRHFTQNLEKGLIVMDHLASLLFEQIKRGRRNNVF
ncbi:hypothetical protein NBRC111894_227 [Sporolactobacillus inulinus]|uniref:Uncharacterized protein n=1 Tax=Sporolactobacillus inulinus TaxID=2078 RepID=A0A4Y1Z6K9_9BACL|nr:hypothetical protein NBRC111894_227 [Sporolactobacillus inulinus]